VLELLRGEAHRLATRPSIETWLARTRRRSSPVDRAEVQAALDATLLTADRRLAAATGPTCRVEAVGPG
jgi:hypothetical protein